MLNIQEQKSSIKKPKYFYQWDISSTKNLVAQQVSTSTIQLHNEPQ